MMSRKLLISAIVVALLGGVYAWMRMYKSGGTAVWVSSSDTYKCPTGVTPVATLSSGCAVETASAARSACNADSTCIGYISAGPTTLKQVGMTLPSTDTNTSAYVLVGATPVACTACTDATYRVKPGASSL
jgi:hypothetical protein